MVETTRANPGLFRRLWRSVGSDRVKLQRFSLNAYGKLPIYKDFISTGLTDPAAREFKTWLDRAFSHRWSVDENYRDVEIAPHSFLFRLPDGKGFVAGSLWGSSDEGGLRRFPFTLFLSFPAGQAAADPLTAVEYLSLLEARARDLREQYGSGASLASFHQTYRGASLDCPLKTRDQIRREIHESDPGVLLSTFAESILGADGASAWPSLLEELSRASSDGAGAIRLPLGGALPRHRELEFWLLWIAQQDRTRRRPPCGILYPSGAILGRTAIFFRELKAEDIFLLHSARVEGTDVFELPTLAAPSAEPAPEPAASEASALAAVESSESEKPRIEAAVAAAELEPSSVTQPEADPEPLVPESAALDTPFLEAEAPASEEAASGLVAEPLLIDAEGRPRLTQAPFRPSSESPIPAEVDASLRAPEAATAAAEGVSATPAAEPPTETEAVPSPAADMESPIPAEVASLRPPEAATAAVEEASAPPAAEPPTDTEVVPFPAENVSEVTTSSPPSVSGVAASASAAPTGWDRPLFAILEA